MKKMSKEVFLGVRFLISLYFLLISFSAPGSVRSTLVVLTAVYFSLSLVSYLKPERTRLINRFVDLLLLPPLVFVSNDPRTLFSLIPPLVLHTNRNPLIAGLLLAAGVVLSTYRLSGEPLWLFATLILLVSSPISAMIPDYLNVLKKERDSIKNLRSSYRKLLQDFSRWERDRRELENLRFLLDASTESQDVESFLRRVRERFNLRRIRIIPKREIEDYTPLRDRERGLFSVPVKLEEGNAVIIFELENPFQLNDEVLVSGLERAGRMINLYIAGFSGESTLGRVINIG